MSGDKPGHLECSEALERMFLFLDHEMDDEGCHKIREHLADCEPCLEKYDLESMVKSLVQRSCGCDKPPSDLAAKVKMRIRQVQIQLSQGQQPEA